MLLELRIVTSASVSCIMNMDTLFVGFSIHCSAKDTFGRVLAGVVAAAEEYGLSVEAFDDFVFLGVRTPMNLNSFECWLKRRSFFNEDYKLGCHLDKVTAVGRLSTTMEPTEVEYDELFPAVYLTPLLLGPRSERLAQRDLFYVIGELFGVAEHWQWFHGHASADAFRDNPGDFAVYIKVVPITVAADPGNVRLVREIFALELCRNCCPHVIRIADMFM